MPHLRVFYIKIWYLRYCVQFVFGFDLTTFIALVRLVDMRSKVTTRDIEAHEQLSVDYGDSAPNCYPVCFWIACGIRRRTIYDNINQYHVTSKHTSSPCTNWLVDLHLTHWGWYFDPATLSEVRTEATKAYNEDLTHLQVWSEYG